MRERAYFVYILASSRHGTLYIGITNELDRRLIEHRTGAVSGYATRYGGERLVHVECFDDVRQAIQREMTLKRWNRARALGPRVKREDDMGWGPDKDNVIL